jgi:hypothetical protein
MRWLLSVLTFLPAAPPAPSGDACIRGKAGGSEIVITTTRRLAGAIHSLRWGGKEFIDSADHGRQLQSASNLDCGRPLRAELYNPTEAGARADGAGPRSSSRLLWLRARGNELSTQTRMAFWLAPGEKSGGHAAYNTTVLSDHLLAKRVRVGWGGLANVIDYQVTFTLPRGEKHTSAVFEALTGYMPPEFGEFWKWDAATGKLARLDDGPGEQGRPVVFANAAMTHAMGVYSPDQPSPGFASAGYGRFRFAAEKVVKWNCVFRVRDARGVAPGDYRYQVFVVVGTREAVRQTLGKLAARQRRPGGRGAVRGPGN